MKPISISLSPNVEKDDVRLALWMIFQPWKWKKGLAVKQLEDNFKKYLGVNPVRNGISNGVKYAFAFNSGRSAFYAILKALNFPAESEVLMQAFTCNAVPNPVLWAGLKPVYVDCNKNDFNIDINDLKSKISNKNKVLVVQHTFGQPANMDEVSTITKENNLILIEDCAHALGSEFNGQKVGTFGRASFFSFGRDKVISCVYGGMATTNDDVIGKKLEELQKQFGKPSLCWISQQILHPIILSYIILPIYNFLDLGKIFLVLSQGLHILSKAVSWKEKKGKKPDYFPKAMPNALAVMAQNQFNKLEKFNKRRQELAKFYYENLQNTKFILPPKIENTKNIFLRFFVRQDPKGTPAHEIIYQAWHKENILIGDWYTTVIAPFDTDLKSMGYEINSCPAAENLAKITFNLPTHVNISQKDAQRIVDFLKKV